MIATTSFNDFQNLCPVRHLGILIEIRPNYSNRLIIRVGVIVQPLGGVLGGISSAVYVAEAIKLRNCVRFQTFSRGPCVITERLESAPDMKPAPE